MISPGAPLMCGHTGRKLVKYILDSPFKEVYHLVILRDKIKYARCFFVQLDRLSLFTRMRWTKHALAQQLN